MIIDGQERWRHFSLHVETPGPEAFLFFDVVCEILETEETMCCYVTFKVCRLLKPVLKHIRLRLSFKTFDNTEPKLYEIGTK